MNAFDGDGCIVVWNAECERVTGYSTAEIVGNPLALQMLYPDIEYRTSMLEEANRRLDDDYSSVWKLTAKNGARKIVEWFNVGARLKVPGWFQWSIGIDICEFALKMSFFALRTSQRKNHDLRPMTDRMRAPTYWSC
jgi:PAS domain S-box-containing protein